MKTDILSLRDSFKISEEVFEQSRYEALRAFDMYHNRHYTAQQEYVLENRGQPKETFNIIKLFSRLLLGYYSTVVNNIKVNPIQFEDIETAAILNDLVDNTFRFNNFISEGEKIKLDGMLAGLMCSYTEVLETGETDEFGRPKYDIKLSHVPALEIALDPMSKKDDYSDARFIHRYKWIDEEQAINRWGEAKIKKLQEYYNHLEIDEAEFEYQYNERFTGRYKVHDNYLIVHTIVTDNDGKVWSIFWCDEEELERKEVTFKKVANPYRVQKTHTSNRAEYYGIYRDVMESQHAINQAVIKIQTMVNTLKALVEETAVENMENFTNQFSRVNAVIPVKQLQGIKIENLSKDVLDQYTIVDKALDRIQRVLGINDSFLGLAYASDSGSKVKLQREASVIALRYLTSRIENYYRLLGWDVMHLIQQYYTAHDVVRIVDNYEGQKWLEINRPLTIPTGQVDEFGNPQMRLVFEEVLDPENNEPLTDENGAYIMAPIPTKDTEIAFTMADISVETIAYNDEDERNQIMLDSFLNGPVGNMLSQINPVGYFKAANLSIKNVKSKYSLEMAGILEETAQMLGANPQAQQQMQEGQVPGQMGAKESMNQLGGRPSQGGQ